MSKVIGALLLGALSGIAMGVLFAPQKGSKTRSRIYERANDMADDLMKNMKDQANTLLHKAEEL